MRLRMLVGVLFGVGVFVAATMATGAAMAPTREWTMTDFFQPTLIAGTIVTGPVLIVHDEAKMEKGEPCTTVYRFDRVKGPQEELVSFACKPVQRSVAQDFTATCRRLNFTSTLFVLDEYQFAGDTEAHAVPTFR
jgi:hypothetical protein